MTLQVGDHMTLFYNHHNEIVATWRRDNAGSLYSKTTNAAGKLVVTANSGAPKPKGPTEYIYLDKDKVQCTYVRKIVFYGLYSYQEKYERPVWTLMPEQTELLGYACQKAVAQYKGREWTAWFAPEIPVDAGPWKLSGLPGLILKAEDAEGHYLFEAVQVERPDVPTPIMSLDPTQVTQTTQARMERLLRKIYEDRDIAINGVTFDASSRPEQKINFIER